MTQIVRMWCLLFVVCSLFQSLICKEYASNLGVGDDEMNLIYNIAKRLAKNSESRQQDRVPIDTARHHSHPDGDTDKNSEGECSVVVNDGIIIRTEDSIQNGADFLGLSRDAVSQGACTDHCCKKPSCDTAVFAKKGEHKCFLFSCQGRCQFSHHGNFSSSEIHRHIHSPASSSTTADSSESDKDEDNSGAVTSSTPSTTSTTTTTVSPHSGERCPVGKFECQTSVDGNRQCISLEEVCDSITQCADGSDERNCSHAGQLSSQGGSPSNTSTDELHNSKEHHTQGDKQGSDHSYPDAYHDSWEDENKTQSVKDQQTEGKQTEDKNNEDKQNQHSSQDQNMHGSEEKQQDRQDAQNKTSFEEVTPEQHSPTSSPEHPKIDTTEPTADRTTPTHMSATTMTSLISTSADGSFVSRKKVGESVEVDNLQVPIIALSVGLAFTLILLVFVTCRLCTVRRRLRKGRPLHSNEADYLINGMYL